MDWKEKPPDDYFKCVKVSLKNVLKHYEINQPKINNTVIKAHKIVIHTLQFMKLYLLNFYDTHKTLPKIDKEFINCCMKIICKEASTGRPPNKEIKELKNKLSIFYNTDYKPLCQDEKLDYTHMNTILDYQTIDILTMYENNIKQHYIEYVERYVNVVWEQKFITNKIRKIKKTKKDRETSVRSLNIQLRKIKNDLLNIENTDYKSNSYYHKWISEQHKLIAPNKDKFRKDNLYYDLQCNPQDYLPCMVFMMKEVEKRGYTTTNPFPLRNDIIAKHIRLDTTTLVHLLMTKHQGKKSDYLFKGNLKRFEDDIWKFFFRTDKQCFTKKWYSFHHMIETDGVSCSILLLRKDKVGKRIQTNKISNGEQYIDEVKDYSKIQDKKIVGIDPGKCDLLFCVDNCNKDANEYRYSQDRRRKETKSKKYGKILLEKKQEKIDEKTIIEYETELCKYNRKTLDIEKFKEYCKKKNEMNYKLFEFYEKHLFRKLKLNGYWNRLKSEQKLINQFKKKFGDEKDTIICIGDYEQRKHMKFKEPIKGKGMRTLFRKNGYDTYLVDEFRTSCKCSKCDGGNCEKFMIRENPKPFQNNLRLVHGLLSCKNCANVWNRDCNGATNIYKIAYNSIHKIDRPSYLCRSNLSGTLDDVSKPKFTRSETGKPC